MRVRLKLTRDEYRGLGTVVQGSLQAIAINDLITLQVADALRGLVMKVAAKVPTLKAKGNRITLTDMETLALWEVMNDLVQQMPPFEMSLCLRWIEEIDGQRSAYVRQLQRNIGESAVRYLNSQ